MKTALRQCIDEFEGIKAKCLAKGNIKDALYLDGVLAVLDGFIEKEKDQLMNAHHQGQIFGVNNKKTESNASGEWLNEKYIL